jgi:uncharacterized protein YwgA
LVLTVYASGAYSWLIHKQITTNIIYMSIIKELEKTIEAAKQDAIKTALELVDKIDKLTKLGVSEALLSDEQFKNLVSKLSITESSKPTKEVKDSKSSGTRRKKVTNDEILKYLATEHSVGDIRDKLGQLVPNRLKELKKIGNVSFRMDGLKKLWKAK